MTIFALSTELGVSGIAVIRLSQQKTKKVIKLLIGKEPPNLRKVTLIKINKIIRR